MAAAAANAAHGLKRSNADKRRAVEVVLKRKPEWSDRQIGEHVGVGHQLVSEVRRQVDDSSTSSAPQIRTGRDGKKYPAIKKPKKPKLRCEPVEEEETRSRRDY